MRGKHFFDFVSSLVGLTFLSPLFVVIAVWIRIDSPGPVFFRQVRVGRYGRPFRIFKFRTMYADAEARGRKITVGEDPRITRAGRFLRKFKLDELPQLFNVIKGEMSLVGPRPEVPQYLDFYPEEVRRQVLSIRPGITDFASILYRDESTVLAGPADPEATYVNVILPEKLKHYVRYVSERTFWLDLKIILLTVMEIIRPGKLENRIKLKHLVLPFANFILDTTFTLFRRLIRRERWYQAHRSHFYQRMTGLGMSHRKVTSIELLLVGIASCAAAAACIPAGPALRIALVVSVALGIACGGLWVWGKERAMEVRQE